MELFATVVAGPVAGEDGGDFLVRLGELRCEVAVEVLGEGGESDGVEAAIVGGEPVGEMEELLEG